MKLIIPALIALVLGVVLGAIPFINQHLHWNFFVIVPISGLILGACFGWIQFQVARLLHARIGVVGGAFLTLCSAVAYEATDVGIWATSSVTVEGGEIALRDSVTLPEFLGARLSHSSISARGKSLEVGSTATLLSFGVDMLGALLGGAAMVFGMSSGAAYCERCSRYRKDLNKVEREYPLDEARAESFWQGYQQLAAARQYAQLAAHVQGLPAITVASRRKLEAQESACPKCKQAALALSVHRFEKDDWTTDGRELSVEAQHNEAPQLAG